MILVFHISLASIVITQVPYGLKITYMYDVMWMLFPRYNRDGVDIGVLLSALIVSSASCE